MLALLAAGLPVKSIAPRLGIGIPTVKTYTGRTYRKLGPAAGPEPSRGQPGSA